MHNQPSMTGNISWFQGEYRHRHVGILIANMLCVLVGTGLSIYSIWRILAFEVEVGFFPVVIISLIQVVGICSFAIGLAGLHQWLKNCTQVLELSAAGISYGIAKWQWSNVAEIALGLADTGIPFPHLRIWMRDDRGQSKRCKTLLVDTRISEQEEYQLVERLRSLLAVYGVHVRRLADVSENSGLAVENMARIDNQHVVCKDCGQLAAFHIFIVEARRISRDVFVCAKHAESVLHELGTNLNSGDRASHELSTEDSACEIRYLVVKKNEWYAIYLREVTGSRVFRFEIAVNDASAIYWYLKGTCLPRPATHQALAATIQALQGSLQEVIIERFTEDGRFILASLDLLQNERRIKIDVRPSDALNLAVVCNVPIVISHAAWEGYKQNQGDSAL
jgi:bifunctional DNase/RNase